MKNYPGLINLIANDREAMNYFRALPDHIKIQISKHSDKVTTIDQLRAEANSLQRNGD